MLLKRYYRPSQTNVNPLWRIREDWDRVFGEGLFPQNEGWSPSLDVVEEKEQYLVRLELPGVASEDVTVTYEDEVLTVAGERKEEKSAEENKVHLNERFYGRFERSVRFPSPVNADQIAAKFNNGVLEVRLPKSEESKPRQIQIAAE